MFFILAKRNKEEKKVSEKGQENENIVIFRDFCKLFLD
jgi:hypothetical protein